MNPKLFWFLHFLKYKEMFDLTKKNFFCCNVKKDMPCGSEAKKVKEKLELF